MVALPRQVTRLGRAEGLGLVPQSGGPGRDNGRRRREMAAMRSRRSANSGLLAVVGTFLIGGCSGCSTASVPSAPAPSASAAWHPSRPTGVTDVLWVENTGDLSGESAEVLSSCFRCTLTHGIETDIVGFSLPFRVLRVKRGVGGWIIGCLRDAGLCEPEIGRLSGRRMKCSHAGKVVPRGDPSGADIWPCWLALPEDEGG